MAFFSTNNCPAVKSFLHSKTNEDDRSLGTWKSYQKEEKEEEEGWWYYRKRKNERVTQEEEEGMVKRGGGNAWCVLNEE